MRRTQTFALSLLLGCLTACGSPAGPPVVLKAFAAADTPITATGVVAEEGGWRIDALAAGPVRLFEVEKPSLELVTLTYRAKLKAQDVAGKAYLEMWVRVPGRGEFFSRGLDQPVTGTSGWASYEIPFFLNEKGVAADLVKLNVGFEGGGGTVWIKDVELLEARIGG